MLKKTTFREIRSSLGRYIAIMAIVALGVGFFSGLKVTREAMVSTASDYLSDSRFFDYQIMSTLGFTEEDVKALSDQASVAAAAGSVSVDALYRAEGGTIDQIVKLHSVTEGVNTLEVKSGRLPQAENECAVDYRLFAEDPIGKKLIIADNNDKDTLDMLKSREYIITGTVVSPIYLNFERGSTSLGDGKVDGFAYLDRSGFDTDYFTEIYLRLNQNYQIYSQSYDDIIEATKDDVKAAAELCADKRYKKLIREAKDELEDGQREYDENYAAYQSEKADAEAKLADSWQQIQNGKAEIEKNKKELNDNEKKLKDALKQVEAGILQTAQKRQEFEAGKPYMSETEIAQTEAALSKAEKQLAANKKQIQGGLSQVAAGRKEMERAERDLPGNIEKYEKARADAEAEFAKAEKEFKKARRELREAREEIRDIKAPDTFVLDRYSNVGYACFESDSTIVDSIAKVFPIFFFLIAALVCMTTMTRMVDEQRTQIGVMKALGYSNGAIAGKYLFYSGSAAFIGCMIGFFSCCYVFPEVIWVAYGMMYDFSADLYYIVNVPLGIISLAVSLLCSMGATMVSCWSEFREVPAQLIRPKAPKDGKRILLERIPLLWNRLSFLYKVSLRNIFRYKKRFFMMVVGISGCTALLLTGLGLRDSVKNVVDYQFDEIQVYDYSITFDKDMTAKRQEAFLEKASDCTEDILFVHQSSVDLIVGKNTKSVTMIASGGERFDQFVNLKDAKDRQLPYPAKNEAVLCSKLADDYGLSMGDMLTLRNEDGKEMSLSIVGICENYVYNYVYISQDSYVEQLGESPEIKCALVHAAPKPDADGTQSDERMQAVYASSAKVLDMDHVAAVSVNQDMRNRVGNMMKSLDYVIALVILSAGALAFIVLYNLTNINITERIREIATIKVLGFYPGETSSYVFRENIFLTAISALVGLGLGKWLHAFVMYNVRVDLLCFDVRISWLSYVLAVALTFVFAFVVNLAMYYKLDRISMTESLKSIE
ncbi:FtsX-like permease family protein [Ihubacter sp. mB4P-1]|uniref:FtsX-like permease family protein n=1 Tax=Ihubacter sp. mB4P-1 TaxID=3242370 RepID=UPI003C79D147